MMSLLDSKKKADVYRKLTQKVGVCLSTLGPGATNLATGVASANMSRGIKEADHAKIAVGYDLAEYSLKNCNGDLNYPY
jgi:Thiamine pyrophosphate enzyme, N-terminal TPP binding domain